MITERHKIVHMTVLPYTQSVWVLPQQPMMASGEAADQNRNSQKLVLSVM